jgi:RNA polymerase sigma-70 factor (sigma-E family)
MVDKVAEDGCPGVIEAGWDELFAQHYGSVVRLGGLLLGDFHAGEEVAQEAFARLFEGRRAVRDPAAYLRATVVNLCRSRIRRAIVARRSHPLTARRSTSEADAANRIVERSVLRQALMKLSRRQREAIVLRYYAQLSDSETAEVMGISVGSVKTHLHRGIAALSVHMEER